MDKTVKKYAGMYRDTLRRHGIEDAEEKTRAYAEKLTELYASDAYRRHNIYPSIQTDKVYAVIAMCLMLRGYGYEKEEIFDIVNGAFRNLKALFRCLEKIVDALPCAWAVAKKWNINDYKSRLKDGSITFDYFNVEDGKIAYSISKCMYVEMFAYYGIREYCKIFCMTDTQAYANLTRHVKFVRHSDLSDGECCHDEVIRV